MFNITSTFVIIFIKYHIMTEAITESFNILDKMNGVKPILWSYWENKSGTKRPAHIDLCFNTFKKHCSLLFDIKILDEKSIFIYLPNLRTDINVLKLQHKTDYIRIALLFHYGGLWVDADTIIMKNLLEIVNLFRKHLDFIGFCDSRKNNKIKYGHPTNSVMGSKQYGKLMKNTLFELDKILDQYFTKNTDDRKPFRWFDLGKKIIWKQIAKLIKTEKYSYHHFPDEVSGHRNPQGKWITPQLIFKKKIKFLNEDKIMFINLVNNRYMGNNPKYNWFSKLSRDEILYGEYFISSLFRKSLGLDILTKNVSDDQIKNKQFIALILSSNPNLE